MKPDAAPITVGRHTTYFEEPDIIFLRLVGAVSEEEAVEISRRHLEAGRALGHVLFLLDLERLRDLPAPVRRIAAESLHALPTHAMAVFRAPLRARVIAKMVVTALNLFREDGDKDLLEFFATEEEARAWLVLVRDKLLSAA